MWIQKPLTLNYQVGWVLHNLLICFALNSSKAMDLHASLENDPTFSCDRINTGEGSRACIQMTKWVKSLFAVHDKQKVWNEERDEHWVQTLLWQSTKKLRLATDAKIHEKSLCMIKTDDELKAEIKTFPWAQSSQTWLVPLRGLTMHVNILALVFRIMKIRVHMQAKKVILQVLVKF